MRGVLVLGIVAIAFPIGNAQAQAVQPAGADPVSPSDALASTPPTPSQQSGVQDIVVTAQKRSERLQDVPISIIAATGPTLAKAGITSLDGIQRLAPGLAVSTVGSGWVSYTYLRGAGTNQTDAGADPSIAYYLDEVYLGGLSGLQFDLLDIDRVEVLKGPQGTLFGRNAAAGAISVTSKRPSTTPGADATAEVGDYNDFLLRGSVTGPVSSGSNLLYRLSLGARHRDAFTKNLAGGADPGDVNTYSGRAQLEYRGTNLTLLLTGEATVGRNGMTNQFITTNNKSVYLSPAAAASLPTGDSFYAHYYNVDGYEHQNERSVTGRAVWSTSIGDITSISAYRFNRFNRVQDQEGTIKDAFNFNTRELTKTFSQETRLTSKSSSRLKYILGLYYYNADVHFVDTLITGVDFAVPTLRGVTRIDDSDIKTKSYAAFGQVSYDFTSQLSLTLGGRYTKDKKNDQRTITGPLSYTVDPDASWHSFDPSVTLDYKLTRDVLIYASFRQGFKSGGFQPLAPPSAAIAAQPYLPERVRSYELGLKSTLFDRRLVFNVAVFRSDITDQQISRNITPTNSFVDNAGVTRDDGIDLSIAARPLADLHLNADMTFQHARFRKFISVPFDFAGNSQLRSPDFTGSFSAEYDFHLGGSGTITPHGDLYYRSTTWFDNNNTRAPDLYQPAYGIGNVRLTYTPLSAKWDVSLFVRNVTNEHYYRNILVSGTPGIVGLGVPGDPRTFGVNASIHL